MESLQYGSKEKELSHYLYNCILIENCKIYAFLYICLIKLQLSWNHIFVRMLSIMLSLSKWFLSPITLTLIII